MGKKEKIHKRSKSTGDDPGQDPSLKVSWMSNILV